MLALSVMLAAGVTVLPAAGQAPSHEILVESPTMKASEMMPRDHTPDGRNQLPSLTWRNVPDGTRELAIVCADFGAGNPPPWVHWIIYGIPATATGLPAGLPIQPDEPMPPGLAGAV
jgi:hypothetical protein